MWKSVKLHFSVNTNILDFFESQQLFSLALEISFVFQAIKKYRFKPSFLSQKNEN